MHKSLLKISIAAVLVLLLVCCGAAAAENVAEVNVTESDGSITTTNYTEFADAWNNATSYTNKSKPVTVKLLDNVTTLIILEVSGSSSLTLDLNGHVLNKSGTQNPVIIVKNSGNLTLKDSNPTAKHMFRSGEDGLWILDEDSDNKIISGGVITGGNTLDGSGGGMTVQANCIFTMYGGNIIGNNASKYGGGVHNEGTFNMYGGNITGNSAGSNGGGVSVTSSGTFNMFGGNITENSAGGNGGGVNNGGTFTMSGGNITKNTAAGDQGGGGVFNSLNRMFNMTNGEIKGNKATKNGGGVLNYGTFNMSGTAKITGNNATNDNGGGVWNYNTFNMSGTASITENEATDGGGVFMAAGTFNVKEKPEISGNTNKTDAANNVYLDSNINITVTGNLESDAKINITNPVENGNQFGKVVLGNLNVLSFKNDKNQTLKAALTAEKTLIWGEEHAITIDASLAHGEVTATPSPAAKGAEVTLTVAPNAGYRLKADTLKAYKTGETTTEVTITNNKFIMPAYDVNVTAEFEPIPQPPAPSSGSSRNYGASIWLTATPTPTPTAEATPEPTQAQPTASPVKPQQTSTPAPAAGIIAGLGAAALVFGLRRK